MFLMGEQLTSPSIFERALKAVGSLWERSEPGGFLGSCSPCAGARPRVRLPPRSWSTAATALCSLWGGHDATGPHTSPRAASQSPSVANSSPELPATLLPGFAPP